jgi:hypothetical protein
LVSFSMCASAEPWRLSQQIVSAWLGLDPQPLALMEIYGLLNDCVASG